MTELSKPNITNYDAFKLAERVFYGNVLEQSAAYVGASHLTYEGFNKFIEIVGKKEYFGWITQYLRIHSNRDKLAPYVESGLISGDHSEDFFIAVRLSYFSKEVIDNALKEGQIKVGMSFLEINDFFNRNFPSKSERVTKKTKVENEKMIRRARHFFLVNQVS